MWWFSSMFVFLVRFKKKTKTSELISTSLIWSLWQIPPASCWFMFPSSFQGHSLHCRGLENSVGMGTEVQKLAGDVFNCGVGEDSWESLGLQGDQTCQSKGSQSWIYIAKTDAETPILWPSDVKNWLIGRDPDAGKDWRREEKGRTENEMVGWHHRLNGHQFK